jgi:hypothetical protein
VARALSGVDDADMSVAFIINALAHADPDLGMQVELQADVVAGFPVDADLFESSPATTQPDHLDERLLAIGGWIGW